MGHLARHRIERLFANLLLPLICNLSLSLSLSPLRVYAQYTEFEFSKCKARTLALDDYKL